MDSLVGSVSSRLMCFQNVALDDLGTRSEDTKKNSSAIEEAAKREQQKLRAGNTLLQGLFHEYLYF